MTEAEWRTCAEPTAMLEFLRGKAGDRKLRLFACACCRRIWHAMTDDRSRRAVEVAERYADGMADEAELTAAAEAAHYACANWEDNPYARDAAHAACLPTTDATDAAESACSQVAAMPVSETEKRSVWLIWRAADAAWIAACSFHVRPWRSAGEVAQLAEYSIQAHLLREIFDNPFRPSSASSLWLAWNDGAICKLAQTVYEECAFDRLPLLADALEDAGCTDAAILSHCRQPGEHVRGCWAVDLLLGKS